MAILYDSDGNEVEALTTEEVNAKIAETKTELETQLKEKSDELEKLQTKDLNFKNVRGKVEEKEKEIEELRKEMAAKFSELDTKLSQTGIQSEISKLAGDDEEVAKKISFIYNKFSAPKEGEEDTRLDDAFRLATGTSSKDFNKSNAIYSSGDSYIPVSGIDGNKISDEAKALGKMLGLKDEDFK